MKAVLLAGGFGTRLSEETQNIPKPMVPIGGKPILWHIMKIYSTYGINDFVILLGYKGYVIKEYFANYFLHQSDVTIDLKDNNIEILNNSAEPWKITMIDTGLNTMTGGRIKRIEKLINGERFMLTYGDGVADINIDELLKTHINHGKAVTMTAVQPEGRFGSIKFIGDQKISSFEEKPKGDGTWINGGFFVCESKVFDYLAEGDKTIFERAPLEHLAKDGELYSYKHYGFWKPMDTLRDNKVLNELWETGNAKWKIWN
ncbi:glucose-1-phosphate cytidylyltransferase [Winogradskyella sp.]|uniref:glucose-1-phosphate cytidylyltransferase n=1 Tax=Winogradskyella sp. TaxID=1883156 RepID=UPI002611477E|nr:glucose-1-phosphate cytidylyltransferase [Winogradskyella sp.]